MSRLKEYDHDAKLNKMEPFVIKNMRKYSSNSFDYSEQMNEEFLQVSDDKQSQQY